MHEWVEGLRRVPARELDRLGGWQWGLFDATLHELGLDRSAADRGRVVVRAGRTACLTTDGDASAVAPLVLQLEGIGRVKALIGLPDELFERGWLPEPEPPAREWVLGAAFPRGGLCSDELADLQWAAYCYVYGRSAAVSPAYRAAIEHHYRPFELAVYAASQLLIEPGARLEVTGKAAFLLFERIDIRAGGQLAIHVPFNVTAQLLRCGPGRDRIRWTVGCPPAPGQRH